jgi:hypothetical protein
MIGMISFVEEEKWWSTLAGVGVPIEALPSLLTPTAKQAYFLSFTSRASSSQSSIRPLW